MEHIILHTMMLLGYQSIMDNPFTCLRYLDVALVAVGAQDLACGGVSPPTLPRAAKQLMKVWNAAKHQGLICLLWAKTVWETPKVRNLQRGPQEKAVVVRSQDFRSE